MEQKINDVYVERTLEFKEISMLTITFTSTRSYLVAEPLKPSFFFPGWQREIIYRYIGSGRNSDVIYITPCGKTLVKNVSVFHFDTSLLIKVQL